MRAPGFFPTGDFAETARRTWYLPLLRGLFAVVLGVVALVWPGMVVLTLVLVLGAYWLVDGVVAIVDALRRRGSPGVGWQLFLGIVGALAGLALIFRPGLSTAVLLTIAGVWAVVAGLVILFGSVRARRIPGFGWGWAATAGLLTIALGLLLVLTPGITAALLGIFLGVYLVLTGIAYIALGLTVRSLGKKASV